MRSDSTFSRESSCVLDVRSLVMSYKFVLICFNLLLIVFAYIFLSPQCLVSFPFFAQIKLADVFENDVCEARLQSLFRELLGATCQLYLYPGKVTELKTTAVFWRGHSMAIFLIERGGAAVFCLKWRLQKFLNWIGLSATHSSHKPGLNPSPKLYLLII